MAGKSRKDVFIMLLSRIRHGTERMNKVIQELIQAAEDPQIKQALEARSFVVQKTVSTLDECFRLIGAKPVELPARIQEMQKGFEEEFSRELKEIQDPQARVLFVLTKAGHLASVMSGGLLMLAAAAEATGHAGVSVLLQSCAADGWAFTERVRHLIGRLLEGSVAAKAA